MGELTKGEAGLSKVPKLTHALHHQHPIESLKVEIGSI